MTTNTLIKLAAVGVVAASMAACTPKRAVEPAVPNTPTAPPTGPVYPGPDSGVTGAPTNAVRPGSEQDFVVNVGDRVYFDLDSYSVRADAAPLLDAQAAWLVRYPNVQIRIEGNADERGTREYNLALAARRAEAVRTYLINRGIPAGRIDTISYGKERPIAEGSTEDAFARNRNAHTAIVSGAQR